MELLKDETQLLIAQIRQRIVIKIFDRGAIEVV
ncbi:MAG: Uncharacterised protein [Synechococcus sp. CC9902]|nr:MAG: Uncharacterised protein [Synechococcus sp. CC9902]